MLVFVVLGTLLIIRQVDQEGHILVVEWRRTRHDNWHLRRLLQPPCEFQEEAESLLISKDIDKSKEHFSFVFTMHLKHFHNYHHFSAVVIRRVDSLGAECWYEEREKCVREYHQEEGPLLVLLVFWKCCVLCTFPLVYHHSHRPFLMAKIVLSAWASWSSCSSSSSHYYHHRNHEEQKPDGGSSVFWGE